MSLFTDFHPYLPGLVYPQIGWESNALSSFLTSQLILLRFLAKPLCAVISFLRKCDWRHL